METASDRATARTSRIWTPRALALTTMLLAMSVAACVAPDHTAPVKTQATSNVKQLTERDDGTTVHLRVGDSIAITLPENPTTGYTWSVDKAGDTPLQAMPPVRDRSGTAPGAGGQVSFTFLAQAAGKATISLTHSRPWEDPAAAIGRFSASVVIEP